MINELCRLGNKNVAIIGDLIPQIDEEDLKNVADAKVIYLFGTNSSCSQSEGKILKNITYSQPKVIKFTSGGCVNDNYAWQIIKCKIRGSLPKFDLIIYKGRHLLEVDGLVMPLIKDMLNTQGIVIFSDVEWSIKSSPTLNPVKNKETKKKYTDEQIALKPIKELLHLYIRDNLLEVKCKGSPYNRAYLKI